jgi:hypothetical protein
MGRSAINQKKCNAIRNAIGRSAMQSIRNSKQPTKKRKTIKEETIKEKNQTSKKFKSQ